MARKQADPTDDTADTLRQVVCEQRDELVRLYQHSEAVQLQLRDRENTIAKLIDELSVFREDYARRMKASAHNTSASGGQWSPSGRFKFDDVRGTHRVREPFVDDSDY